MSERGHLQRPAVGRTVRSTTNSKCPRDAQTSGGVAPKGSNPRRARQPTRAVGAFLARDRAFGFTPTEGEDLMKGTTTLCDGCGAPAAYTLPAPLHTEARCAECAQNQGSEMIGKACAAFETLGFAISLARWAYVTDDQIREAFEACLTAPHSEGSYPFGGDHVLGPDSREARQWARVYTEIT